MSAQNDKQLAEYWERKARAHFKMSKTHSQSGTRCALKARELFLRAEGLAAAEQAGKRIAAT